MKYLCRLAALMLAAGLSACGGGGGSGGTSSLQYSIALTADKAALPLNVAHMQPGIGAYAPYTTTLYVSAKTGSTAVPESTAIACNLVGGLESGALYYLDGTDKETTDANGNKTISGSRSVALKTNAGTATFHFHSDDKAGTSQIQCAVTDPRDAKVYTSSVNISVGSSTGKAAWVTGKAQAGAILGTSNNLLNLPNSVAVQASIFDDANQPIGNPTAANLQVSVRPVNGASQVAKLVSSGSQTGSVLQVQSTGGVAQFQLRSGAVAGPILVEFVTDRSDNNVANGIQDPVTSLLVVEAIDQIASDVPLTITSATIPQATLAAPYIYLLQATGGNAPYKWSIQGSLPPGLTISSEGLISGVPSANVTGSYQFVLTVTDSLGKTVKQNLTMTVGGTPTYTPLSITGCSASDVNTPCPLPGATSGQQYLYAFSATGGDPTKAVTWTATPANWLAISTTGSSGVFTGTATPSTSTTVVIDPVTGETRTTVTPGQACTTYTYVVTASQGTPQTTISRTFTVALTGTAAQCAR